MEDQVDPAGLASEDWEPPPTPWSFRIMVGAAALYLVWRLIEGVAWVVGKVG